MQKIKDMYKEKVEPNLPLTIRLHRDGGYDPIACIAVAWFLGAFSYITAFAGLAIGWALWQNRRATHAPRATPHDKWDGPEKVQANSEEAAAIISQVPLPAWLQYPDVSRAVWMDELVKNMWPQIAASTKKSMHASLDPMLAKYELQYAQHLSSLKMTYLDVGNVPLRIVGIQTLLNSGDETVVEMHVAWVSSFAMTLEAVTKKKVPVLGKPVTLTVDAYDVILRGTMRMVLGPHVDVWPCFANLGISFTEVPIIDLRCRVNGLPLDAIPGFTAAVESLVGQGVKSAMVYPTQIVVPMVKGEARENEKEPIGTLVVTVVRAENLPKAFIGGAPSTFVEGSLTGAPKKSQTKTVDDNCNPVFDKRMTFSVFDDDDSQLLLALNNTENKISASCIAEVREDTNKMRKFAGMGPRSYGLKPPKDPNANVGRLIAEIDFVPLIPLANVSPTVLNAPRLPGVVHLRVIGCVGLHRHPNSNDLHVYVSIDNYVSDEAPASRPHPENPKFDSSHWLDFRDARTSHLQIQVVAKGPAVADKNAGMIAGAVSGITNKLNPLAGVRSSVVGSGGLDLLDILQGSSKLDVHLDPLGECQVEVRMFIRSNQGADGGSPLATNASMSSNSGGNVKQDGKDSSNKTTGKPERKEEVAVPSPSPQQKKTQ